jgi:hypothetical protein
VPMTQFSVLRFELVSQRKQIVRLVAPSIDVFVEGDK